MKIEVVMALKQPTNVIKVKSIIGLAGYYCKYVKHFPSNASLITYLLMKDKQFS